MMVSAKFVEKNLIPVFNSGKFSKFFNLENILILNIPKSS